MRQRVRATLKKFIPPLIVILLLPVVIALLFLPESFLYLPPEGSLTKLYPIIAVGLSLFVAFNVFRRNARNADPISQRLSFLLLIPGVGGIVLFFVYGNLLLLLSGIALSYAFAAWINILRFPPRFWNIVRLVRRDSTVKALQQLGSWIQTHPNDWQAFQLRAGLHFDRWQFAEAERDARIAIKLRADPHPENFFQLCQILRLQSLYIEAKQALSTAIALKSDPAYYFELGILCYRLEQYSEAIEALQKATRSVLPFAMSNLLAHYYLAKSFEITGNSEQASKHYRNLPKHSYTLEQYREVSDQLPDYQEVLRTRADYEDIHLRLSTQEVSKFLHS